MIESNKEGEAIMNSDEEVHETKVKLDEIIDSNKEGDEINCTSENELQTEKRDQVMNSWFDSGITAGMISDTGENSESVSKSDGTNLNLEDEEESLKMQSTFLPKNEKHFLEAFSQINGKLCTHIIEFHYINSYYKFQFKKTKLSLWLYPVFP